MENKREVILYGQPNCPACEAVKSFYKGREIDYTYVDVQTDKGNMAFNSDFPGAKSVPRGVVIEGSKVTKITGNEALMRYFI